MSTLATDPTPGWPERLAAVRDKIGSGEWHLNDSMLLASGYPMFDGTSGPASRRQMFAVDIRAALAAAAASPQEGGGGLAEVNRKYGLPEDAPAEVLDQHLRGQFDLAKAFNDLTLDTVKARLIDASEWLADLAVHGTIDQGMYDEFRTRFLRNLNAAAPPPAGVQADREALVGLLHDAWHGAVAHEACQYPAPPACPQFRRIAAALAPLLGSPGDGGPERATLARLVALKDGPRDAAYERNKPAAWQAARDALGSPGETP